MSNNILECTVCDRTFATKKARHQHFMSKHHYRYGHVCEYCLKVLQTANGLERHTQVKHDSESLTEKFDVVNNHDHGDPYDGIDGYWVRRFKYRSTGKSFGYFQCPSCDKGWMSAHAFSQYKQGCQDCERKCLPCCLWRNKDNGGFRSVEDYADNKPHDQGRCEACRRGVCRNVRRC